jgi:hypothetical protein
VTEDDYDACDQGIEASEIPTGDKRTLLCAGFTFVPVVIILQDQSFSESE